MTNSICLDKSFSTTNLLSKEKPSIKNNSEDKLDSVLFLPENRERQGEGGLRTQGYFKKSYKNKPLITVVTVVCNGEKHLEQTIESVIDQTYNNIEYIIIDGGSTDGTLDIIRRYEEQIDYWVSEKDSGIYDAMNKGIKVSSGIWLNFMNAGDMLNDLNVLKKIFLESINFLDIDFIYSNTIFNGKDISYCNISTNSVNHQSLIYKKSVHYFHGLYLVGDNLLISDYLFFMLCKNMTWYKSHTIIANYDTSGISGNKYFMNHFKQKISVDLMFDNISRRKACTALLLYPFKRKILKILKTIVSFIS